jgi:sodium/hydrogen antiporter
VLVGPQVLDWIDPLKKAPRHELLENISRITLGIGLFGVALRIPGSYLKKRWRDMLVLVGLGMPLMWAIGSLLAYFILGLPLWAAMLVGAILAPTDPVTASPIVTGDIAKKNLPAPLRHGISFDSGANDGLAYLFVQLPMLMLLMNEDAAWDKWLTRILPWDIGIALVFGTLVGYVGARLLQWAEKRDAIESHWRLIYTVALALAAIGGGKLIGGDEVLVAFVAGMAFTTVVSQEERKEEEMGQEAVNRFFAVPFFTLLGTLLPWASWSAMGWPLAVFAVAVLLFRRIPVMLAIGGLMPSHHPLSHRLFIGWFGPIAVAAVFYTGVVERHTHDDLYWHIVSLVVVLSVVAHGLTAAPVSKWFGRATGEAHKPKDQEEP